MTNTSERRRDRDRSRGWTRGHDRRPGRRPRIRSACWERAEAGGNAANY